MGLVIQIYLILMLGGKQLKIMHIMEALKEKKINHLLLHQQQVTHIQIYIQAATQVDTKFM